MCAVQFKEMGLWEGVEVVNHEMRYQCKGDSDVHVGHENWARLAVDNSFHIASVHSLVTRQLSVGHSIESRSTYGLSNTFLCKCELFKQSGIFSRDILHPTQTTVHLAVCLVYLMAFFLS